jgi:hypothetical protein
MADGHKANANLGQIRMEGILCRDLVNLKCGELKRFFRNLIDTSISTLSIDVDIKFRWRVIICENEFPISVTAMIKGKNLFPRKLIVKSELLIEITCCNILVVVGDRYGANTQLSVFLVWLELGYGHTCYDGISILSRLKLIHEYLAL